MQNNKSFAKPAKSINRALASELQTQDPKNALEILQAAEIVNDTNTRPDEDDQEGDK